MAGSTSSPTVMASTTTSYVYIVLVLIWIIVMCCCCSYFFKSERYHGQRQRILIAADRVGLASILLTKQQKDQIGETAFTPSVSDEEEKEAQSNIKDCSICLSCFAEGEVCRSLPAPCGHMFHKSCIDQWFETSSRCPLCNRSIYIILEEKRLAESEKVVEAGENEQLSVTVQQSVRGPENL